MDPDRLAQISAALERPGVPPGLEGIVSVSAELLAVSGAGIAVITEGQHRGAVALSDPRLAAVDELQFSLGEGPCVDAASMGRPVLEPDLSQTLNEWPAWTPAAIDRGVHAAFAFPLHVGSARLGAFTLYRDTAGDLSDHSVADAIGLADLATRLLLDLQADTAPGDLPASLADTADHRAVIHQATGMTAAQLDIGVASALARLRAHARSTGRSIEGVAKDVVARRLRLE